MMENMISVIVPVYKVEKYLNACVKSIVNQTYKNLEIILVDDGSPDDCPQMCDEWAKKDSRIKVIHQKNGGLSAARNAGLDIATGKLESYLFYYGNCIYSFSIKQETVTDMFLRETIHKMYNNGFETIVVTCNIDFMEKYLQENCIPYRKITSHGALCSQMRLDLTKNLIKSIH